MSISLETLVLDFEANFSSFDVEIDRAIQNTIRSMGAIENNPIRFRVNTSELERVVGLVEGIVNTTNRASINASVSRSRSRGNSQTSSASNVQQVIVDNSNINVTDTQVVNSISQMTSAVASNHTSQVQSLELIEAAVRSNATRNLGTVLSEELSTSFVNRGQSTFASVFKKVGLGAKLQENAIKTLTATLQQLSESISKTMQVEEGDSRISNAFGESFGMGVQEIFEGIKSEVLQDLGYVRSDSSLEAAPGAKVSDVESVQKLAEAQIALKLLGDEAKVASKGLVTAEQDLSKYLGSDPYKNQVKAEQELFKERAKLMSQLADLEVVTPNMDDEGKITNQKEVDEYQKQRRPLDAKIKSIDTRTDAIKNSDVSQNVEQLKGSVEDARNLSKRLRKEVKAQLVEVKMIKISLSEVGFDDLNKAWIDLSGKSDKTTRELSRFANGLKKLERTENLAEQATKDVVAAEKKLTSLTDKLTPTAEAVEKLKADFLAQDEKDSPMRAAREELIIAKRAELATAKEALDKYLQETEAAMEAFKDSDDREFKMGKLREYNVAKNKASNASKFIAEIEPILDAYMSRDEALQAVSDAQKELEPLDEKLKALSIKRAELLQKLNGLEKGSAERQEVASEYDTVRTEIKEVKTDRNKIEAKAEPVGQNLFDSDLLFLQYKELLKQGAQLEKEAKSTQKDLKALMDVRKQVMRKLRELRTQGAESGATDLKKQSLKLQATLQGVVQELERRTKRMPKALQEVADILNVNFASFDQIPNIVGVDEERLATQNGKARANYNAATNTIEVSANKFKQIAKGINNMSSELIEELVAAMDIAAETSFGKDFLAIQGGIKKPKKVKGLNTLKEDQIARVKEFERQLRELGTTEAVITLRVNAMIKGLKAASRGADRRNTETVAKVVSKTLEVTSQSIKDITEVAQSLVDEGVDDNAVKDLLAFRSKFSESLTDLKKLVSGEQAAESLKADPTQFLSDVKAEVKKVADFRKQLTKELEALISDSIQALAVPDASEVVAEAITPQAVTSDATSTPEESATEDRPEIRIEASVSTRPIELNLQNVEFEPVNIPEIPLQEIANTLVEDLRDAVNIDSNDTEGITSDPWETSDVSPIQQAIESVSQTALELGDLESPITELTDAILETNQAVSELNLVAATAEVAPEVEVTLQPEITPEIEVIPQVEIAPEIEVISQPEVTAQVEVTLEPEAIPQANENTQATASSPESNIAQLASDSFKRDYEKLKEVTPTPSEFRKLTDEQIEKEGLKYLKAVRLLANKANLALVAAEKDSELSTSVARYKGYIVKRLKQYEKELAKRGIEAPENDVLSLKDAKAKGKSNSKANTGVEGQNWREGFESEVADTSRVQNLAEQYGKDSVEGLKNGIDSNSPSKKTAQEGINWRDGIENALRQTTKIKEIAEKYGKESIRGLKKGIDSNSPSKATEDEGDNWIDGLVNSIMSQVNKVKHAAQVVGIQSVSALSSSVEDVADVFDFDLTALGQTGASLQERISHIREYVRAYLTGASSIEQATRDIHSAATHMAEADSVLLEYESRVISIENNTNTPTATEVAENAGGMARSAYEQIPEVLAGILNFDTPITEMFESFTRGLFNSGQGAVRFASEMAALGTLVAGITFFEGIVSTLDHLLSVKLEVEGITQSLRGINKTPLTNIFDDYADSANRAGMSVASFTEAYAGMYASLKGQVLNPREMFEDLSTGMAGAGLVGEAQDRAFTALSQMAGKGVVSMEELRGQLSEALPGGMRRASDAMGLTTQEMTRLVSTGNLLASEFLPLFSKEMAKSATGTETLTKSLAVLANAKQELQFNVAEVIPFQQVIKLLSKGLKVLTAVVKPLTVILGSGLLVALGNLVWVIGKILVGFAATAKGAAILGAMFNPITLALIGLVAAIKAFNVITVSGANPVRKLNKEITNLAENGFSKLDKATKKDYTFNIFALIKLRESNVIMDELESAMNPLLQQELKLKAIVTDESISEVESKLSKSTERQREISERLASASVLGISDKEKKELQKESAKLKEEIESELELNFKVAEIGETLRQIERARNALEAHVQKNGVSSSTLIMEAELDIREGNVKKLDRKVKSITRKLSNAYQLRIEAVVSNEDLADKISDNNQDNSDQEAIQTINSGTSDAFAEISQKDSEVESLRQEIDLIDEAARKQKLYLSAISATRQERLATLAGVDDLDLTTVNTEIIAKIRAEIEARNIDSSDLQGDLQILDQFVQLQDQSTEARSREIAMMREFSTSIPQLTRDLQSAQLDLDESLFQREAQNQQRQLDGRHTRINLERQLADAIRQQAREIKSLSVSFRDFDKELTRSTQEINKAVKETAKEMISSATSLRSDLLGDAGLEDALGLSTLTNVFEEAMSLELESQSIEQELADQVEDLKLSFEDQVKQLEESFEDLNRGIEDSILENTQAMERETLERAIQNQELIFEQQRLEISIAENTLRVQELTAQLEQSISQLANSDVGGGSLGGIDIGKGEGNVKLFLDLIAETEGTSHQPNSGYNTLYTGKQFQGYDKHPQQRITANGTTSSAAGRYQIMDFHWKTMKDRYGDFTPQSQDKYAIDLIKEKGALDDIINGDFATAIDKLRNIWVSFPGSDIDPRQPTKSREFVINFLKKKGATVDTSGGGIKAHKPDPAPKSKPEPKAKPASASVPKSNADLQQKAIDDMRQKQKEAVDEFEKGRESVQESYEKQQEALAARQKMNLEKAKADTDNFIKKIDANIFKFELDLVKSMHNLEQKSIDAREAMRSIYDSINRPITRDEALTRVFDEKLNEIGKQIHELEVTKLEIAKALEIYGNTNSVEAMRESINAALEEEVINPEVASAFLEKLADPEISENITKVKTEMEALLETFTAISGQLTEDAETIATEAAKIKEEELDKEVEEFDTSQELKDLELKKNNPFASIQQKEKLEIESAQINAYKELQDTLEKIDELHEKGAISAEEAAKRKIKAEEQYQEELNQTKQIHSALPEVYGALEGALTNFFTNIGEAFIDMFDDTEKKMAEMQIMADHGEKLADAQDKYFDNPEALKAYTERLEVIKDFKLDKVENEFNVFNNVIKLAKEALIGFGKELVSIFAKRAASSVASGIFGALGGIFNKGGEVGDIANFKTGGTIGNFAGGGEIADVFSFSNQVNEAMKREGYGAIPIVASKGEQVLSTVNQDAQFFRALKKSGDWDRMKSSQSSIPNFKNGGAIGGSMSSTPSAMRSARPGNNVKIVTNYNVKTNDTNLFRKSRSQMQTDAEARARRSFERNS